jgi:hypothetical protein
VKAHNKTLGRSGFSPAAAFLRIFSVTIATAWIVALLPDPKNRKRY